MGVCVEIVLASGGDELAQLVLLVFVGGKVDQELEEASARGHENIQVVGQQRTNRLSMRDMFWQLVIYYARVEVNISMCVVILFEEDNRQ